MGWGWGVDTMGEEKMKRRCNELGGEGRYNGGGEDDEEVCVCVWGGGRGGGSIQRKR